MNVSILSKMDYENKSNWTLGQNKPNSKPNKANFQKAQMNVNLTLTKDYRKKDDFVVRKNKPNSKPISVKAKMNANAFSQKDYENETTLRPKKTNPIKPNFKPSGCENTNGSQRKAKRAFTHEDAYQTAKEEKRRLFTCTRRLSKSLTAW